MTKEIDHQEVNETLYIEYIGDNILIGSIGEETDEPAFALFNANNLGEATKMCRLSFLSPKYVTHRKMHYCDKWIMTKEEKSKLMEILQRKADKLHVSDNLKRYSIFEILFFNKISHAAKNWLDALNSFQEKRKNLVMPDYMQLPEE